MLTIAVLSRLFSSTHEFDNAGHDGNKDYGKDHQRKILFDKRNVAKKIAAEDKKNYPGNAPCNVIDNKTTVRHGSDTCNERSKSANNGYEAGKNNRLPSIFFIKKVGTVKVFFIEEARLFFTKDFRTSKAADPVIHGISCYGSNG